MIGFFWSATMVGKPEGADFGGKKQYEALIDDSIAGTRIKQVTKSRHRIRYTVILFVFILYVSLVLSSWRGSKKRLEIYKHSFKSKCHYWL